MTSTKMTGNLNMRLSPTVASKFSAKLLGGVVFGALMMAATVLPLSPGTIAADEHIAPVVETTLAERSLELFIDESQENGSYGDLRVAAPEFVIDADQENGGSDTALRVAPLELVIDESQENGSYGDPRVAAPEFVIDADQENGGYGDLRVASPELVIDESQENGGL